MVQRLPPVPTLAPVGFVGADPGGPERKLDRAGCTSDDRQHSGPRPSPGSRRKRATPRQGLGRSRGGFTTKVYLSVNAAGLPTKSDITPGQTSDYLGFDLVMDDNLPEPCVLLADRGYNSDKVRKTMETRSILPVVPNANLAGSVSLSIAGSTDCGTLSSGASISSRMPAVSPPATTRPPKATLASLILRQSASGSAICQHDLENAAARTESLE